MHCDVVNVDKLILNVIKLMIWQFKEIEWLSIK